VIIEKMLNRTKLFDFTGNIDISLDECFMRDGVSICSFLLFE